MNKPMAARPFTLFLATFALPALAILPLGCKSTPDQPSPPLADYGDAPDDAPTGYQAGPGINATGNFPSLYDSPNVRASGNRGIAHTGEAPLLRFGAAFDREADARVVDNDPSDDGQPTLVINGFGSGGGLFVSVAADGPPSDEKVSGFLNIALDLNQDGVWSQHVDSGVTVDEWVVQNMPISLPGGDSERMATDGFSFGPHSARTEFWGRLTLTPTPIAAPDASGWDGSGPATGFASGETEDVFFRCEGALDISYPLTQDAFGARLRGPGGAPIMSSITVKNLADQPAVYVFSTRAQVAVPIGLGYTYVDVNDAAPELTITLTAPGVPATGFPRISPNPKNLPPAGLITVGLGAAGGPADTVKIDFTITAGPMPTVLDPTRPPPPGGDNRLGRLLFSPSAPCLIRLTKTNDEPVYFEFP